LCAAIVRLSYPARKSVSDGETLETAQRLTSLLGDVLGTNGDAMGLPADLRRRASV